MKKLVMLLLLLSYNIVAQTPVIVAAAFEKMSADSVYQYSYKKSVQSAENLRVMKYDPTQKGSDCWELISVNDRAPNKKQLKEFYKEVSSTSEDKKSFTLENDDMKNFSLIKENDEEAEYACDLNGKDDDNKMTSNLKCALAINKTDTVITKIAMFITEPVSPMVSVKIDEFRVDMVFEKIAETGSTLIHETKTRIKGRAMIFKEIDENVTEKYFDYKLVE